MCTEHSTKVGLVQMTCSPDPAANLAKAIDAVGEAVTGGANLVCLPELFTSEYFCKSEDPIHFDLAEPVPGPTTDALAKVAKQHGIVLVVPLFERRAAGIYHNSVVTLDADGTMVGHYRKMHIPDDPSYYEKFYFTPGDLGFQANKTRAGTIGTLICWDQWYPEAARLTALQGSDILFYPTAIGWLRSEKESEGLRQFEAWQTVQRSHAIANGMYVAAVNRVGYEAGPDGAEGIEFWGGSFLCDPMGEVLAEASREDEQVLVIETDLGLVERTRRDWPFLRDRRIDAYDGITRRFLD